MKKIVIILLCIYPCWLSFAQQNGKDFYYYFDEKIYLTERVDKMFIKLTKDADRKNMLSFIQKDTLVNLNRLDETTWDYFILLETKEGTYFSLETLTKFKRNPNVLSAQFILENGNNKLGLSNNFTVKLKSATLMEQLENLVLEYDCMIIKQDQIVKNQYVITIPSSSELNAMQMANLFYETELFEFSEPNFGFFTQLHSNDYYFDAQWGLKNTGYNPNTTYGHLHGTAGMDIKAEDAWQITQGNLVTKIAVIDVGVDPDHPDLIGRVLPGYDLTGNYTGGAPYYEDEHHGTQCAGIICAKKDNGIGIAGVAPYCNILPVKFGYLWKPFGSIVLYTEEEWIVESIRWAYQNGASVLSNSWEVSNSAVVTDVINEAVINGRGGKGCVVVFSSGNSNHAIVSYPASLPSVIAVGAIDSYGYRASFSNYGSELDIVAPSENIITTNWTEGNGYKNNQSAFDGYSFLENTLNREPPHDSNYCFVDGTSAACPHVAGVAALILSINPSLTGQQVRTIIESTAQKIGNYSYQMTQGRPNGTWNAQMGYGLVNAYDAVLYARCYTGLPIVDGTITQNTTWNTPVQAVDIIIPNGVTLTITSTVKLAENCKITILPGGKLIVDGGTLTNACPDKMWQGIYVGGNGTLPQTAQNQGILELKNGAVIENAKNAIATYSLTSNGNHDWNSHGGIIKAENTTFRNNGRSVEYMSYPPSGSNQIIQNAGRFTNCTFTLDDNNLFAVGPLNQFSMWAVTGVKIEGCTFENNITNMPDRKHAIYTIDAGYIVDEICKVPSFPCTPCRGSKPSSFKGFNQAIESLNATKQYTIKINHSEFENNNIGVSFKAQNTSQISRLNMMLNNNSTGIYLDNCTNYKIEGNEIYSLNPNNISTGIHVDNAGTDENKIYRNRIYNTRYGIKVDGNSILPPVDSKSFPATGLQFMCNNLEFNNHDIGIFSGTVRAVQGSPSVGADNLFSLNVNKDIYFDIMSKYNLLTYYRNITTPRKPPICNIINVNIQNANSNPCPCTLGLSSIDTNVYRYKSSESSIAEYHKLNLQFAEMMKFFYDKGYDKMLTDYYNGIIENEELLREALKYHESILTVTETMADISNNALFTLSTDSIIDLNQIRDWYDEIYTLNAKYSLAETYYQLGKYEQGFNTLARIPKMYDLNEEQMIEHNNYVALYTFKNKIRESGRTIAQLKENEIEELIHYAKVSNGLSSVMAQGILCFFYEICINDEMMRRLDDEMIKEDESNLTILQSSGLTVSKNALENIKIYPNPTTGELRIENGELRIEKIEISDVYGRKLSSNHLIPTSSHHLINISHLPAGVYFLSVRVLNRDFNKIYKINKIN